MKSLKIGLLLFALAACVAAPAHAQNSRWADPYRNGVKAFEARNYAQAVALLERAVAADPKAASQKYVEGVFRLDYFPYYYLALSYVELQQWDKASQNLDKARPTLTRQQTAKFNEAETKIKLALNASPGGAAPPPRNAAFDSGVRQAEAAVSGRNYDGALKQFDQLRALDANEYAKAGLGAKRDEAAKSYASQLTDEGRALLQNNRINDAKAKLQLADQTVPGQKAVADALADIKKREDDYRSLKAAAQTDFDRKNYSSARDRLQQAQAAQPELFAADNLSARLTEATTLAGSLRGATAPPPPTPTPPPTAPPPANAPTAAANTPPVDAKATEGQRFVRAAADYVRQGKYAEADAAYASAAKADPNNQEAVDAVKKAAKFKTLRDRGLQANRTKEAAAAQQALLDARTVDPDRFSREGLTTVLDRLTRSTGDDPIKVTLRQGLLALLNGRAQESIAILEPAASRSDSKTASLHAYLGVAYATRALSAPKPDDQIRFKDKALEQFRLAAAADRGYQLSTRIVSPTIVQLYESARR